MYGVQGRSWVAMGEPIGLGGRAARAAVALSRALRPVGRPHRVLRGRPRASCPTWSSSASPSTSSASRRSCRWPASVSTARPASGLRQASRRAERDGAVFTVVPAEGVPALMPELRAVSDAWLAQQERQGEGVLARPLRPGLSRPLPGRHGAQRVPSSWRSPICGRRADRRELSIDLMRFRDGAPARRHGLSVRPAAALGQGAGLWPVRPRHGAAVGPAGPAAGAACGPAPVPCCSRTARNSTISRACGDTRRSSGRVWEPRYLAAPGGLALATVLADVTVLVSGSAIGVVRK